MKEQKNPFEDNKKEDNKKEDNKNNNQPDENMQTIETTAEEIPNENEQKVPPNNNKQEVPLDENEQEIPLDDNELTSGGDDWLGDYDEIEDIYESDQNSDATPLLENDKDKKSSKKRRKKKKKGGVTKGIIFAVSVVVVSVALALTFLFAISDMMGVAKPNEEIRVDIPKGSSTQQIAEILQEKNVINSSLLFRFFTSAQNEEINFQYGTFKLNSAMSYEEIIQRLEQISAKREGIISLTFPEGIRLKEIADMLLLNGVCDDEEFIEEVNNKSFGFSFEKEVSHDTEKFHRMEGFIFPDTYHFFENQTPREVITQIFDNFESKFDNEKREKLKEIDMTMEEVIILASIIQQEASKPRDMRRVAGVFFNRIQYNKIFPRLESDPTRVYVRDHLRTQIKPFSDVVYENYMKLYNTYERKGLPVGAICNPGIDAINAVLNPIDNKYYYFCSNVDTGKTYFAVTLSEHEQNLFKAGIKRS